MKMFLLCFALVVFAPHTTADMSKAPAFVLADVDSTGIAFPREHDGVDVYFFWASWCPYCKALMPHLQSMQIEYGDDIKIFAFNIRDDEDPEVFMQEKAYDFTLMPEADPLMKLYDVHGTPAVFLVDGEGLIRFNLYEMIFSDSAAFKNKSHTIKAASRAPHWAAEIRKTIDQILAGREAN